jgi:hypothetical protein
MNKSKKHRIVVRQMGVVFGTACWGLGRKKSKECTMEACWRRERGPTHTSSTEPVIDVGIDTNERSSNVYDYSFIE